MKNTLTMILALVFVTHLSAQETSEAQADTLPPVELQRQIFVYSMAKKYGDEDMAKTALYNILSITPGNVGILDSLALMYFQKQSYASAALVSQDIVSISPDNMLATEIAATSFENLGVKDRALPYYEKLYLNNNSLTLLYQIAFMQYELKRYTEANTNIDVIMSNSDAANEKLYFSKSQTETQEIPLTAAIHRLKAMIAIAGGDNSEARVQFNKALEIVPDFEVVKIQLQALN